MTPLESPHEEALQHWLAQSALPRSFYMGQPVDVATALLGTVLVHRHPARGPLVARIVETEAYGGEQDLASHAARGRTPRNDPMYGPPGHAYIYLVYGMHEMLNVVTGPTGTPTAVLLRAVEPLYGLDRPTNGPGRLTRAMDIDRSLNRVDLTADRLILVAGSPVPPRQIVRTSRIGVDYAGPWAALPWRFYIRDHPCVSRVVRSR